MFYMLRAEYKKIQFKINSAPYLPTKFVLNTKLKQIFCMALHYKIYKF